MSTSTPDAITTDPRWQAVLTRDRAQDSTFVYAVRSTGVYCRPTCPSRRPRPTQVAFFASPAEAEHAGYRACRRCHPRDASAEATLVAQVCAYIDAHLTDDTPLTLPALGAQVGVSPTHLQKTFTRALGVSPRAYAEAQRRARLQTNLHAEADQPITETLAASGYHGASHAYRTTPTALGMTPRAYRAGAPGETVRYTLLDSALGAVLLATTTRGVCRLTLGDDPAALEVALTHDFPRATLTRDDDGLRAWSTALAAHLAGHAPRPDLPLDVRATAFQARVWAALRAIPAGATRSYTEIAHALGAPRAARAVARACATNPVAVLIPCHRVVRTDGALGGYRWGLARKARLLANERNTPEIEFAHSNDFSL